MIQKTNESKICLIYTGGTIGMQRDSGGILSPPEDANSFLNVAPELKELADFDYVPLMNKDSTNMNQGDWTTISDTIHAIYQERKYDGFVVAHGTDTMHFSASAVALALGANINFPVVFTGAQTAPDVQHGDARINLLRAFKVAASDIAEVVISFGDYVFRGCRAQKKDERKFDAFESPAFFPLAYITENILVSSSAKRRKDSNGLIECKSKFAKGIFQVALIPGLEPELMKGLIDDPACKGIILHSFGAGNVPNEFPYSLTDFIRHSTQNGTPVLIASQFPANATLHTAYEPGREAIKAGAIPTGNMTSACATAKFRWVLAQVDELDLNRKKRQEKITEMMNKSYIGELDEVNDNQE